MKLNPRNSMSSPDEAQKLANTKEEELWKQELNILNAVTAEAKEFINLLDSRRSMPKASVLDDLPEDSTKFKDQLPSFESDALHSDTSIGEQKQTMETVGQDAGERDQTLAESVMLQNKSDSKKKMKYSSGIGENDSGTESCSEDSDSDDDVCIVSPAEWDASQSYDQSEQPLVMQALQLFNEELSKLSQSLEKKKATTLHIEAVKRVRQKGFGVPKGIKRMGHIPGIQIGEEFRFRAELVIVGLHSQLTDGIDFMKLDGMKYAISVVNSWCYENEARSADTLIYSGHGGNPKVSNRAAEDQKLEKGNLALHNSMDMEYPVRVIQRNWVTDERKYAYMYYGLYKVVGCRRKRVELTRKYAFKFELQRLPEQPKICSTNVKMGKRTQKAVCVLKDISEGKEKHPVGVFRAEDDVDMPFPFTYITKNVYPHWYKPVDPIGCNCIDGCSNSEQCPCVKKNGGNIPFNEKGALVREKRTVVYECGPSCKCPPSCMNRVTQHAPPKQFEIFKTISMGWGLRCRDYITSESFICEYLGELLGEKEAEKRADNANDEYLFDICPSQDEEGQFEGHQDGFTLDAARYGNVGRFMNHSCSPNVFSQEVIYDNDDHRFPHIMFFASKDIPPKRELMYDYNCKSNRVRG